MSARSPRRGVACGLAALVCLLVSGARAAAADATPSATLTADAPTWDAGAVAAGTSVTHSFTLTNHGPQPLKLTVKPDCGCTTTRFDPVIAPGGTGKVEAALDTTHTHGRVTKAVRVTTDDATLPQLVLSISVEAVRLVEVSPSDRPLLRGAIGAVPPTDLIVTAPKESRFEVVRVEDDEKLRATLTRLPSDATPPADATAGGGPRSYRVTLTPAATLEPGTYHPTLTLITNVAKADRVPLTPTVVVTGPLTVEPQALQLRAGEPARQIRVTTSRPSTPFHVLGAQASNPGFTAVVTTVADGRTYDVGVTYRGSTPGDRPLSSILKISTDEPSQPLLLVRLTTAASRQ